MTEYDRKFKSFYRINKPAHSELLEVVEPLIQKQITNMRECFIPQD